MHELDGILERITFQSESNGYTVAQLRPTGKRHTVTIVGNDSTAKTSRQILSEYPPQNGQT